MTSLLRRPSKDERGCKDTQTAHCTGSHFTSRLLCKAEANANIFDGWCEAATLTFSKIQKRNPCTCLSFLASEFPQLKPLLACHAVCNWAGSRFLFFSKCTSTSVSDCIRMLQIKTVHYSWRKPKFDCQTRLLQFESVLFQTEFKNWYQALISSTSLPCLKVALSSG